VPSEDLFKTGYVFPEIPIIDMTVSPLGWLEEMIFLEIGGFKRWLEGQESAKDDIFRPSDSASSHPVDRGLIPDNQGGEGGGGQEINDIASPDSELSFFIVVGQALDFRVEVSFLKELKNLVFFTGKGGPLKPLKLEGQTVLQSSEFFPDRAGLLP